MTTDRFRRYGNLLRADGTNQQQRLLPGLEADYVVPDERSLSELLDYARRLTAEVRFFDLNGQATGDWQPLFELLTPANQDFPPVHELLTKLASRDDWPPHLVLFLVFLRLFQNLQGDLNQLTQRHLLYYYEKRLGLLRRPAAPDDVHVLFELAQNAASTLLPAGTLLDAGKDDEGRPLLYSTQNELVVSAAAVADMRRYVREKDKSHNPRFFVANGFSPAEGASGYTFGRSQLTLDAEQRFMTEAPLGFGVAAPILQMAEGERRVSLLARMRLAPNLDPNDFVEVPTISQDLSSSLDIQFTGAEGWLSAEIVDATFLPDVGAGQSAISFTVQLPAAAAAVVVFDPAIHGPGMTADRAAMRCLVKGESGYYRLLSQFNVEKLSLDVDVKGVRKLVVQNDDTPLDANSPLPLFGSQPRIGSTFYIGSSEIFSKRLTGLALHLEWKSPPDDLFDHYRAYFDNVTPELTDTFSNNFRMTVDLLYERSFHRLLVNQTLFEPVTTSIRTLTAQASAFNSALPVYTEQPDVDVPDTFTSQSRFGFLRCILSEPTRADLAGFATAVPFEAFGHPIFGQRYAFQAVALSTWKPADGPKPLLPSEPYTPVLNSLTLDYHAVTEVVPGNDAPGAYYRVGPFGATRVETLADARAVPVIPGEAALLLGIRNLKPPGGVAMFFDIDMGTATGATVLNPADIEWSYLAANDTWRRLTTASVLIDSTQGFQKPGIIAINVPQDATVAHQSLPSDLVWLRALIHQPPESAARTISVRTHATLARFSPGDRPLADFEKHLQGGLPAATISRLAARNASIRKIEQPNPSFGGQGQESTLEFVRRSSERLRHRNRAVTAWDLERLVLERFSDVFKVKCLTHTDQNGLFRAGHTALVIVPNLRRTGGVNLLEPRAGEVLLAQIAEYLASLTSPFMTLHVIRPVFERLRVEAKVVFARGRDPGYYTGVLNDELRRFLSPWAYQEGEDILFGARIYRSEILAFIEGRDYVDHLVGLRVFHNFAGEKHEGIGWMTIGDDFIVNPRPRPGLGDMRITDDFIVGRALEVAQTTQAHAILVSHPEHLITAVAPGAEICSGVTRLGIGYMTVGLDFNVALEAEP